MVRTFPLLPLLLLFATLSTFWSNNDIFTTALPTPILSLTQQTIHPLSSSPSSLPSSNQTQNQNQKLCGLPLLYLYPCTWTSDPSIPRVEKLPPVIFVKYIFNIPGTLLDSIFAPLVALEDRSRSRDRKARYDSRGSASEENENGNERGHENGSSNKRDLQHPLQPGSKHQLLGLEKETQEQEIWSWCGMAPLFIFPCKAKIPDQEDFCTSTGSMDKDRSQAQCVKRTMEDLKSSVPGMSSLPKLWIETVMRIPRGIGVVFSSSSSSSTSTPTNPGTKVKTYIRPSLRIRDITTQSPQTQSSPPLQLQLERLNKTTTLQESTTLKYWEWKYCMTAGYVHPCAVEHPDVYVWCKDGINRQKGTCPEDLNLRSGSLRRLNVPRVFGVLGGVVRAVKGGVVPLREELKGGGFSGTGGADGANAGMGLRDVVENEEALRSRSGGDDTVLYNYGGWKCEQENGSLNCVESGSSRLAIPSLFRFPTLVFGLLDRVPRVFASIPPNEGLVANNTRKRDLVCDGGGGEPFHNCRSGSAFTLRISRFITGPYMILKVLSSLPGTLSATIPRHIPGLISRSSLASSNTTQLEDLTGETMTPGTTVSKELCWFLGFLYPCSWNLTPPEAPKPGYVKQCYDDSPSKSKWYKTTTCQWQATSSRGLSMSKSIPRIFTLAVLFFKSAKAIPLSFQPRRPIPKYRSTRSPSPYNWRISMVQQPQQFKAQQQRNRYVGSSSGDTHVHGNTRLACRTNIASKMSRRKATMKRPTIVIIG